MLKKKYLNIYIVFLILAKSSFVNAFNFSVAPTKIEINLSETDVKEIYLANNTDRVMRLICYFETPKEYEKLGLEEYVEVFPKLVSIQPKDTIIVKVLYKMNDKVDLKKEYKSYIIFKELPHNTDINNKITVYSEIGIGLIGKVK